MANYNKVVDGKIIALTDEEQSIREAEEKAWADATPARHMALLRKKRDALLAETDYMALGDMTMTDAWKTYRQALRDITKQTPSNSSLSNIKFPEKPKG